jgi:tetratricopeptide (TPR) repeat protein
VGVTARRVIAVLAALLMGVVIVRNAAVGLLAEQSPDDAARVWPGNPDVEISSAMTQIALAARSSKTAPSSVFPMLERVAVQDPLAPEPYLVRGVQLNLQGKAADALRSFEEAQWRDPRSLPAAYFLADQYVREGKIGPGLRQIAALARLSPNGGQTVGPYIASFAANPENWPALRTTFSSNPGLAEPAFDTLSSKIETVPSLLALVDAKALSPRASWFPRLLDTLIKAGQYDRAKSIWARASNIAKPALLYDEKFSDKGSLPPFNWSLTSNAVGLAERQAGGRMHVIYYGQEDGILATQLLTLPPGAYRFSYKLVSGASAANDGLTWSIWCDKSASPAALTSVTLRQGADRDLTFVVPPNCPAQWLRLSGASGDIAQQSDATMGNLNLKRLPGA